MMKRLLQSLFAGAFLAAGVNAFAIAPTIADLPEVTIGDAEQNIGTDNNFFVFTNAFAFDSYVSDPDSTVSSLIWSFDEGNPIGPNWFNINDKPPVAVGAGAIAAEEAANGVNRLNPGAGFDIRLGQPFATFRDVIFSPPPTNLPYPDPNPVDAASHLAGKAVRFYVSDGTNVTSQDTLVNSEDDGFDALSPSCTYSTAQDDNFTTDVSNANPAGPGWFYSEGADINNLASGIYEAGAQSLSIQVGVQPVPGFTITNWASTLPDWMPYGFVGSSNVARGKFYVYAAGQSPATANRIPDLRLKLSNGVAVASTLEVLHTNNFADDNFGAELAPSFNSAAPSIYRVDYDPVDVPVLAANAGPSGLGGIQRTFEAYGITPQNNGKIHLTQSEIGVYPLTCTPFSVAPSKSYAAADFANFDGTNYDAYRLVGFGPGNPGSADRTAGQIPVITHSGATGVTLSSIAMPSSNLGLAVADFTPFGKVAGSVVPADYAALVRVEEGKQYSIRWHMTSTRQTNLQSQIRLRSKSARFNWSQKLEIGSAWPSNNATVQQIAQQTLPGVGTANPDGGWYHMILHTPLSGDIRADIAGPITTKMPLLSAAPGPGSTTADLRRAVQIGVDLVDTISANANAPLEQGLFVIDEVQIRTHNLVAD
jgi:hypothetical protein